MKRFRPLLTGVVFTLVLFAVGPASANAATASFFGPIISPECTCPGAQAPGWGCILQTIQNFMNVMVSLSIIIAVLAIAYAGILFIFNATNPEYKAKARGVLLNALIGLLIVFSAWLVIDFVMKIVYDPGAIFSGQAIGPWNDILGGGPACIAVNPDIQQLYNGPSGFSIPGTGPGSSASGGAYGGGAGVAGAQCSVKNTACSVSSLQSAGLTSGQANAMSCIAVTESSGDPSKPPYNTVHAGSNSTACGTFQVTQTTWNKYATGGCSSFSTCTNAACNEQVAVSLVKNHGYSDWTCPGCNNKAQACVAKYDSGG